MDAQVTTVTVADIVDQVAADALMGVPADYSGVPMAVTRALIRRFLGISTRTNGAELRLYCLPYSTIQADMLIGAGLVREVEAAAITLGEFGLAPCFSRAVEGGTIKMKDSTCPALHAQLQATEKGVPFMPLGGLIGSDIAKHRPDWKVIDDPFSATQSSIVLLPAVQLDVAIFHAAAADRHGNIWIGRRRELATMAHASKQVFVTIEEIRDVDFFETEEMAAGVLPGFYVDGIAVAPHGAAPVQLFDRYEADGDALKHYAAAALTEEGFQDYLKACVVDDAAVIA